MSLRPVPQPALLILLHLVTGGVLCNATISLMTVSPEETSGYESAITPTSNQPMGMSTAISKGAPVPAWKPNVILYCLEDGRKMLLCDSGSHSKVSFHWTKDGKDLEEGQPSIEHNGNTITLAKYVTGELVCKVKGQAEEFESTSIKVACQGETWLLYSFIMAAGGGTALLMAIIVSIVTCCCGRKSRSVTLVQDEMELGSVFVDPVKNSNGQEFRAVEETKLMSSKTDPNPIPEDEAIFPIPQEMEHLAPEEDGRCRTEDGGNISVSEEDEAIFPIPQEMEHLAPEEDGRCRTEDGGNISVSDSDGSDNPEDKVMEKRSSGVEGD